MAEKSATFDLTPEEEREVERLFEEVAGIWSQQRENETLRCVIRSYNRMITYFLKTSRSAFPDLRFVPFGFHWKHPTKTHRSILASRPQNKCSPCLQKPVPGFKKAGKDDRKKKKRRGDSEILAQTYTPKYPLLERSVAPSDQWLTNFTVAHETKFFVFVGNLSLRRNLPKLMKPFKSSRKTYFLILQRGWKPHSS